MPWFILARIILSLVQTVEPLFGKGSGALKKQAVTDTTKTLVESMKTVSTGGQKKTWEELADPVSSFIDDAAGFLFRDSDAPRPGA